MQKEPDILVSVRAVKQRLMAEAGNDMYKRAEMDRKRTKELGFVTSNRQPINSPGIDRMLADFRIRRAKRREKIDAYLAKRAARNTLTKPA